jgi:hypothetical protein
VPVPLPRPRKKTCTTVGVHVTLDVELVCVEARMPRLIDRIRVDAYSQGSAAPGCSGASLPFFSLFSRTSSEKTAGPGGEGGACLAGKPFETHGELSVESLPAGELHPELKRLRYYSKLLRNLASPSG